MFLEFTLKTTDGKILRKSKTNVDCCVTSSISESEDGTNSRSPIVTKDEKCTGGTKQNLQAWIDESASKGAYHQGLCYEKWFYAPGM